MDRKRNLNLRNTCICILLMGILLAGCSLTGRTEHDAGADSRPPDTAAVTTSPEQTAPEEAAAKTIALSLPDESSNRWTADAANMQQGLEALGYRVLIQYAQNDPQLQASQIREFIEAKADCIVIAAANPNKLKAAEASALDAEIPVIAYDELLMGTDAVSFYVTFDQKGIGNMIGREIVKRAGLENLKDGGYRTIEFFAGPADDRNSRYIYDGLMEVLQPYLDNGTLVCNTGRTSFEDASVDEWSQDIAKERCSNYLEGYYKDEDLDICAVTYDGFAYGCKAAFMMAGYTQDNWPIISGVNCEPAACRNILDGTQTFSICKDTRMLAAECVALIDALLNGMEPGVNNVELYDNGTMTVPARVCSPIVIDADNLQEVLIDGGYYTPEEARSVLRNHDAGLER